MNNIPFQFIQPIFDLNYFTVVHTEPDNNTYYQINLNNDAAFITNIIAYNFQKSASSRTSLQVPSFVTSFDSQ